MTMEPPFEDDIRSLRSLFGNAAGAHTVHPMSTGFQLERYLNEHMT